MGTKTTKITKPPESTARKTVAAPAKAAKRLPVRKTPVAPRPAPGAPPAATPRAPSPATTTPAHGPGKTGTTAQVAKATKLAKQRVKLVRDSFAMPEADFALIDVLKARAIEARRPAKKSELLRAGLKTLHALAPAELVAALDALTPIKTGRPKKGH